MSSKRSSILDRIRQERERQADIPGSEFDAKNSPNDWIAIATYYLAQETRRATMLDAPSTNDFEKELIKAAAVIVAALEHTELMKDEGKLS
jgi:translation elongation factor EF-1alpha